MLRVTRSGKRRAEPEAAPTLLGLIAEHVSDLTYAQPEQIILAPVLLPQAPYLGAIVQTDQGIVQLIVRRTGSSGLASVVFPGPRSGIGLEFGTVTIDRVNRKSEA